MMLVFASLKQFKISPKYENTSSVIREIPKHNSFIYSKCLPEVVHEQVVLMVQISVIARKLLHIIKTVSSGRVN